MKTFIDLDDPNVTMRTLVASALREAERCGVKHFHAKVLANDLAQIERVEDLLTAIEEAFPRSFTFEHDPRGAGPMDYENCTQREVEHGLG